MQMSGVKQGNWKLVSIESHPRLPPGAPYRLSAGREPPYPGRSSSSSPGSTSTSPGSAVTGAPGLLPPPDPGLLPPDPPEGGRGVREGAGKEFEGGLEAHPPLLPPDGLLWPPPVACAPLLSEGPPPPPGLLL